MKDGIRLSRKHGVNPTIPICFFCGEDKNEIALLGQIGGKADLEAPMRMILDYEPCDKCKEKWNKGYTFIEVQPTPLSEYQPPIQDGLFPTGSFVVVQDECKEDIFPEIRENMEKHDKIALVSKEVFQQLTKGAE